MRKPYTPSDLRKLAKQSGPQWDSEVRVALLFAADLLDAADLAVKSTQPTENRYPLPDSLYLCSKDWVQGDYAERVEWLHSMYENQREQTEMYVRASQPVAELTDEELEDIGFNYLPLARHADFIAAFRAVLAAQKAKR